MLDSVGLLVQTRTRSSITSLLIGACRKAESVQRKFTKRLPACSHLSYPDRLVRLNPVSLVVRRLRHDLILTYKIRDLRI